MKLLGFLLRKNGTSSNGQTLDMELELNLVIIVIKGQYARQLKIEISRASWKNILQRSCRHSHNNFILLVAITNTLG